MFEDYADKHRRKRPRKIKLLVTRLMLLALGAMVVFSIYVTHGPVQGIRGTRKLSEAKAQQKGMYDLNAERLEGGNEKLIKYAGLVSLVTNVASECGYTDSNYKGLQKLYDKYRNRGFVVLGFPCNQFGAQEPGKPEEIRKFVQERYGITFPLFQKVDVHGKQGSPVFEYLTRELGSNPEMITWNFHKFLVDRNGKPIKHYDQRFREEEIEKDIVRALNSS